MAQIKRVTDFRDLLEMLGGLKQDVAALVAAVDDLRYEIEEWQRHGECPGPWNAPANTFAEEGEPPTSPQVRPESSRLDALEPGHAVTVAQECLRQLERRLTSGRVTDWASEWDGLDVPDLPTGTIVQVDEILWSSVLDLRPTHVAGLGCDCEPAAGAPYLFAWHDAAGWFLRELNSEEALSLQAACLAAQREAELAHETANITTTQRALW